MEETHILVVDDNPEIREIIHILLQGEGFITTEAADGIQALAALRERDFDLIILDIMMPQLNGYQTCLEIRKTCNAPGISFRLQCIMKKIHRQCIRKPPL